MCIYTEGILYNFKNICKNCVQSVITWVSLNYSGVYFKTLFQKSVLFKRTSNSLIQDIEFF